MSESTPEQIELYGKKQPRPLLLDANVVAYFADLFGTAAAAKTHRGSHQRAAGFHTGAPASSQLAPAFAQSRS